MLKEWFDKFTSGLAYLMSLLGMGISKMTYEHWYFTGSLVIGVLALILNYWHKREMQRIATEKGVTVSEAE